MFSDFYNGGHVGLNGPAWSGQCHQIRPSLRQSAGHASWALDTEFGYKHHYVRLWIGLSNMVWHPRGV